jgi:hypothetical protein
MTSIFASLNIGALHKYFAGPEVPCCVLFTVRYTWFCSLSVIILVPVDIWVEIIFDWMMWLVLLQF